MGRKSSFNIEATSDKRKFPLKLLNVNAPPTEINASGRATEAERLKPFSIAVGKPFIDLEYTMPAMQAMIKGFDMIAFVAS